MATRSRFGMSEAAALGHFDSSYRVITPACRRSGSNPASSRPNKSAQI
jgi:hypothetical protein